MATQYSQIFTLKDIFNNKNLKNKIPLINYKEIERDYGKVSVRTNMKTITRQVFDTSTSAARPFYNNIKTTRAGNRMVISGDMVGSHNDAVNSVYLALLAKKQILEWTVNNGSMIRSALKESEKNKRIYGINSPLYLKVQSMMQIEGMSKQQLNGLLDNVMENIIFGDDFPETQRKYKVKDLLANDVYNYEQQKLRWKYKVGDI